MNCVFRPARCICSKLISGEYRYFFIPLGIIPKGKNQQKLNYEQRSYRNKFNSRRFKGFQVKYLETDLWIGCDPESFQTEMQEVALDKIKVLRQKLDDYIKTVPEFAKTLNPFQTGETVAKEAIEMAKAAEKAGIGPMSTVAALFARETGIEIIQNFSVKELVIENGGDIYACLKNEMVLSVFAGRSPISEEIGIAIPSGTGEIGICTSAGTVGPSLSFGKADAVAVVCKDVLLADALATALGNEVKSPADIEKTLELSQKYPDILSVLIICEDKLGVRGELEIRLLK